jgi:hypothetical protein
MSEKWKEGNVVVIPSCIGGVFRGGILTEPTYYNYISVLTTSIELYGKRNITVLKSESRKPAEDDIQKCGIGDVVLFGYDKAYVGGIIGVQYVPKLTRYEYTIVTKNDIWTSISDYLIKEVKRIPYEIFVDCMIDEEKLDEYSV